MRRISFFTLLCIFCGLSGQTPAWSSGFGTTAYNPTNGTTGVVATPTVTVTITDSNAINSSGNYRPIVGSNVYLSTTSNCTLANVATNNSLAWTGNTQVVVSMTPTAPLTSAATYYACVINNGTSLYIGDSGGLKLAASKASFTILNYSPPFVASNKYQPVASVVSALTPTISATFNNNTVDLTTVTGGSGGTVTLEDTTGGVAGPFVTLSSATDSGGVTASFTPVSALTPLHTYTVNLATGATGCSNCIMNQDAMPLNCTSPNVCSWSFEIDNISPTVQSYTPNTVYVRTANPVISATFSAAINSTAADLNTTSFKVTKPPSTTAISGSYAFNAATNTATFTPTSALTDGSTYMVALASGATGCTNCIQDTASPTPNILSPSTGISWTFTVDKTHPVVSTVSPANGAANVSVTTPIVVNFTETGSGMNTSTMNANTVMITNTTTGNTVPISSFAYSGANNTTLTMNTPGGLDYGTTYTVTLATTIADIAGNALSSSGSGPPTAYSWSFTTLPETPNSYAAYPPSVCGQLLPNVLIILDNSNSFDEDLQNNAIGSPTCTNPANSNTCSKSVLARQVLTNIINTYGNMMNLGIMSYKLPAVSKWQLHNCFYFNSYDPRSYCPTPPTDGSCYNYCVNEDPKTGTYTPSAAETACNAACRVGNALFTANYRDVITTTLGTGGNNGTAIGSARRQTYCTDIYPKTQRYPLTGTDPNGVVVYYGPMPGTFYNPTNAGTAYLYSGAPGYTYNPGDYPGTTNGYYQCTGHSGTTDTNPANSTGFSGCSGVGGFIPTDDDYALGFANFGSRMYWYYTSPTFFSNDVSPGIGYLNVPIAAPATNQISNLLSVVAGNVTPEAFMNDPVDYMACTNTGNPNPYYTTSSTSTAAGSCGYIINAGLTPTAGTFNTALSYFKGTLNQAPNPGNVIASPIGYPCQKNYVIFITDGSPSVDTNGAFGSASTLMPNVLTAIDGLRCPTSPTSANCQVSLNLSGTPTTFDTQTYVLGVGLLPPDKANVDQMAIHGGTAVNGHAYYGDNPTEFQNSIYSIFENILNQVSSGTAASILNNSQGSGANLLQAMFYPSQTFDNNAQGNPTAVSWIGEMQNLWYYVDPYLQFTNIREDTNQNFMLDLKVDKILQFIYNQNSNQTLVERFTDANGDGTPDNPTPDSTVPPNEVNSLWQAGLKLWQRNLTTDPRTIYTGYNSVNGSTPTLFNSATFNSTPAWNLLQIPAGTNAYQQAKATTLINFISGADQPPDTNPPDADGQTYRSRTVTMDNCGLADSEGCNREWKLGDIVSSTPKIVSNLPLGTYQNSPPTGYSDSSYLSFLNSQTYQTRGMAFVGANDGMLHAFKFGTLKELSTKYTPAELTDSSGNLATAATNLGHEEWAFIPANALPYLTYYTNPGYKHMFYVDRTPVVVDASIGVPSGCTSDYSACPKDLNGDTWRTIIIGGMGFGGASRPSSKTCNQNVPGPASTTIPNCIQSPISNGGLSSYFALDVTDPENPKYLWEFSGSTDSSGNPLGDLGAATSGPAIVRVAYRANTTGQGGPPDNTKNGKWYAIFASGPTGPIDTLNHQFYGYSDQNLKIFVVDLATGALVQTFDAGALLGITNAFAGSITSNTIDTDRNNPSADGYYSDDAVYIGYTQLDTSTASAGPPVSPGTWTKGGVLRLTTADYPAVNSVTGKQWQLGTLINNTGPVTTAISKLQDVNSHNLWIYFGSGRFFFKDDDPSATVQRQLYGIKEPCYSTFNRTMESSMSPGTLDHIDSSCNNDSSGTAMDIVSGSTLVDQSGISTSLTPTLLSNATGWTVDLDAAGSGFLSERVITDPIATSTGAVFFTTLKPNSSPCTFGGDASVWALGYNSGYLPPTNAMLGQLLLQVSTGQIAQMSMQTAFANPSSTRYNGRRLSAPITGMPPVSQGLSLIVFPKPSKQIIQIREK